MSVMERKPVPLLQIAAISNAIVSNSKYILHPWKENPPKGIITPETQLA